VGGDTDNTVGKRKDDAVASLKDAPKTQKRDSGGSTGGGVGGEDRGNDEQKAELKKVIGQIVLKRLSAKRHLVHDDFLVDNGVRIFIYMRKHVYIHIYVYVYYAYVYMIVSKRLCANSYFAHNIFWCIMW